MSTQQLTKEIEMMAENERALARLYEAFGQAYPGHNDFWKDIALDELQHASCIVQLGEHVQNGTLLFESGRFPVQALERAIKYIDGLIRQAQQNQISLNETFGLALDLEKSLIEKGYLEVFETDAAELKQALNKLAEESRMHYDKLQDRWEKVKNMETV